MRTPYSAPTLTEYGGIDRLTGQTLDSARVDFFVDANGNPTNSPIPGIDNTNTGSLDLCVTRMGDPARRCMNPPAR